LVQVCFNKDWLPYILGCLFQLTLSTTWSATGQDLQDALQMANDLILIFQLAKPGCAVMPSGPEGTQGDEMCCCLRMVDGNLQVFSCGEWKTVDGWDASAIAPRQPGTGSPQPPDGGCQKYSGAIEPTVSWLYPTPVSAGDTVTVSNLQGAWSPSQFTDIWLCPDGNLFFAGFCVDGTQAFDAGAPMPSAPLNGTILFDGTNYYDVSLAANPGTPVTVTIAPGVSNAQLLIRCNFHGGVEPAGTVTFDTQVCNNQVSDWTATLNFALDPNGFARVTGGGYGPRGTWSPGIGWTSDYAVDGGGNGEHGMVLQRTPIAAFHIKSLFVSVGLTKGTTDAPGDYGLHVYTSDGVTPHDFVALTIGAMSNGSPQSFGALGDFTGQTLIFVEWSDGNTAGGSDPGGSAEMFTMTITGTGANPF
jgi:hypothetical protein